ESLRDCARQTPGRRGRDGLNLHPPALADARHAFEEHQAQGVSVGDRQCYNLPALPTSMSDPLRTDVSRAFPGAEADRDAKIEQLLLVGLDHYFAAQFDQAINVWTRALFLDRSHARARAYIERARS